MQGLTSELHDNQPFLRISRELIPEKHVHIVFWKHQYSLIH